VVVISPYPWAAGFYDMNADTDHCTTNSTALPEMLKPLGYRTHALGKWDVGFRPGPPGAVKKPQRFP